MAQASLSTDSRSHLLPAVVAFSANRHIHSTVTPGLQMAIVFSTKRDSSDRATGRI
jgi:hypothetical protein